MSEREQLEQTIAGLEAQRRSLGDAAVDAALAGMRQKLAELRRAEEASQPPPAALAGERKLVTIMFADLSGFTALSERMDPEAVRELTNACFFRLVPVVRKYEGTVDKFIGDAIMARFGAPVTHENDAEQALRAALEMMDDLQAFNAERNTELGMHIGISTGTVIAGGLGSVGEQQYSVMGDAVNVAARLEEASETGEILVGPDTYRLVAPLFEFDAPRSISVKGKAEPVNVYRLQRSRVAPGTRRLGLEGLRSPLVGRDTTLRQLQDALEGVRQGQGGIAAITGEAGLGKSRLVAEARQQFGEGLTWAEGRGLSYGQEMSYWVVRELLCDLLEVGDEASPGEIEQRLRQGLERLLPDQTEELYPFLAHLLDLPLDEPMTRQVQRLSPSALQQQLQRGVAELVKACAREQSVVLVGEDLHWTDPSSLQLFEALLPLADEAPVLLLLVFRPEGERILTFHQQLRDTFGERYQVLVLNPLTREESDQLVQNLLQIENLPAETRQLILGKTEGNPFFVEEVLRSLLDAGLVVLEGDRATVVRPIAAIDVPDTLQGVIAARIDRLSPNDKRTLQTAAVIGRVFQQRVLANLAEKEQAGLFLEPALRELHRRALIRRRSATLEKELEYVFKHAVTWEVTYNSILLAQRKTLHQVAGKAIEALFPDQLDELAATLAYHYERAEVVDKAVVYLQKAGEHAVRLSANEEAIAHFTKGLEFLDALPETPERAPQELDLQLGLGVPLTATRGMAAPELGSAYARARALCQQLGETPQLFPALYFLSQFYQWRAEYPTAIELAEQMLRLARGARDPLLEALAHTELGWVFMGLGDLASARAHLEHMISFYDPQLHHNLAFTYGLDPGVFARTFASYTLWPLGYPDQALKQGLGGGLSWLKSLITPTAWPLPYTLLA